MSCQNKPFQSNGHTAPLGGSPDPTHSSGMLSRGTKACVCGEGGGGGDSGGGGE